MQLCNYFGKLSPFNLEGFRFCHVLAVLCLIYITAVLIKWWIKRKHSLSALEQFPGPPGHWLLGHITQFKEDGTDLDMIPKWGEQYPFAFPLQFGPDIKYLYVHHPDYAKPIMATSGPKEDFAYAFLIPWIGEGLLVSSGQKWFRHRRLLTPGFHYDILKPYVNLMADSAKVMLDKWEVYARTGQTFELFQHVSLMTLDSIMKCAFSCQSNCQTESSSNPYIKAVYELSILVNLRFYIIPYHNDIIFYMSPQGYRYRKACKIAHAHTEEVIRQRRDILNKKENQNDAWEKRYLDFLDILLCARDEEQKGLSDEAIRAEVDTFMFEGHDTTASGISWIFYSMACNPEHQQKCREEIQQVLQGKDTMEWEDLNKIPYTTMCIKESLRMYPPVPGIARRLSQPITFFDGRNALAGQRISINIYGIHHNPTVWKNPKVFDPLRFLPENTAKRSPYAFLPFSAGPRNCIGQNFALNEMKVAVALTLKKYVLIKDPDHTPKMISRLVLRSLNGIHLRIKLVEN